MQLEGSCECGKIRFTVTSSAPQPYRICYCRRCRKIGGGVGAAINILAEADSLIIRGELEPKAYEAPPGGLTVKVCPDCATALFIELAGWPAWVPIRVGDRQRTPDSTASHPHPVEQPR